MLAGLLLTAKKLARKNMKGVFQITGTASFHVILRSVARPLNEVLKRYF